MRVRTSIRVNNDLTIAELVELAQAAESLGFDQLWVSNDLFLRSAPVLLATLAANTSRIQLGSGILNPCSMHPAEIAMAAATLQEVSGGRFRLGVGAGADEFLEWARIRREPPLPRTREAILVLRALLRGDVPDSWDPAGHLRFGSGPVPIYVGAMSPKLLELAGELADGALPLLFPPEHFETAAGQVAAGAARAGRSAADLDIAACIWCSIDADRERAEAALAEKFAYYGRSLSPYLLARVGLEPGAPVDARMLRLGVAGGPEEIAVRCQGLVGAGARHLSFGPPLGPSPLAAVELIAREVLPRLAVA